MKLFSSSELEVCTPMPFSITSNMGTLPVLFAFEFFLVVEHSPSRVMLSLISSMGPIFWTREFLKLTEGGAVPWNVAAAAAPPLNLNKLEVCALIREPFLSKPLPVDWRIELLSLVREGTFSNTGC